MTKLKNPIIWFVSILMLIAFYQASTGDRIESTIRSDGRGYYAYLPAIFIYKDATYQKSMEAEKLRSPLISDQLYVYKDDNGNYYNKYFPGVAIMQLPFFGLACLVSWISGYPIDGYNSIFWFFFFVGGLFYGITGIFLFTRFLRLMFPNHKALIEWIIPVFYCSTPLLFYSFDTLSFSHLYSFFLFGLFALAVIQLREERTMKRLFLLGVIVGLIVLVRPTNGLVIFMIPFILGDLQTTKKFIEGLLQKRAAGFFVAFLGFLLLISVQFFIWKWQSGEWIKWSYNGEGFNFLQPQLFSGFFSLRIGLFVHVPMLILAFLGLISIGKKEPFQVFTWLVYFGLTSWVILSWWCWDYESNFGPRPYTEHLFFLLIPVIHFVLNSPKWITLVSIGMVTLNGSIRYLESRTGFMGDQRFTKENFISSLQFWESNNHGRWNFTRSITPFGRLIDQDLLLNEPEIKPITPENVYSFSVEKKLDKARTDERLYYRVKLDKKQNESRFENVFLVIDAYTGDEEKRYYKAVELMNDRFEGTDKWAHLEFEGQLYDNFQEYDFVRIYIWNLGGKTFYIQNMEIVFETYKK